MDPFRHKTEELFSYLLVSDDNYFDGLIAQINSIIRNTFKRKIYLVHNLSPENLSKIEKFIYKSEKFDESPWLHLPEQSRHIKKISLGRFQADFVEEDNFFYMDTDIIQKKTIRLEKNETIAVEFKTQPVNSEIHHIDRLELMRKFILDRGGKTEKEGDFTLFADSIFYVNKKWLIEKLRPKIIETSKEYVEKNILQRYFDMQYFHTAICLYFSDQTNKIPIKNAWLGLPFNKEKYPNFFHYNNIEECELLHFCGAKKPWMINESTDSEAKKIWSDYYHNGPIKL
jgi:lipopolysaccharide biosynthesis glycosyltransferase